MTSDSKAETTALYVLGRTGEETERLQGQAEFVRPLTERLFRDAGIGRGMKVLDLGSGAGDVALLLARLVGPEGAVVGIDKNPSILETARVRAQSAGYDNVTFEGGDIRELSLPRDFDAVVGRFVLMYMPDPASTMRAVADHLRTGGIAAFQEPDFTHSPYAAPPSSLLDQIWQWISIAFRKSGADLEMGLKLRNLYLAAGFSDLHLEADRLIGGGADWGGYDHLAGLVKSVLPFLEANGIATAREVQAETLAERLRQYIVGNDGVVVWLTLVRLWGRKI
ncbi:MAG: class I SAM-dependent methyltransferase [Bradyrhizobium sp.]|nr:class I SAM-dependent methyltransferase [Bradyrhizobium sp.]